MLRFICTVLITLALCTAFSSCASLNQQKPTPASEYAGLRKTTFNDGTILSYASDAGDLQAREGNLSDSYYNGKQMILGVLDQFSSVLIQWLSIRVNAPHCLRQHSI